ncbi:MAG: hypothetical protein FJX23_09890, partial [Alphaproteobacteria bacterium]|nr:hypothetical protein [Alphaproteobacteria bacterium]
ELDKVKNRIIGAAERSVEDITKIGDNLAFTHAVDGKVYDLDEDLAILKGVTLEQVQARAKEIFKSPPSVSVHGNDLSKLPSYEQISAAFGQERTLDERGLVVQTEQEAAAALARAVAPGKAPVLPPVVDAPSEAPSASDYSGKPEVTVLENGLKVITQRMPTKQIFANVRVGSGERNETAEQAGLATIASETSDAASQRFSIAEKSEAVANLRGVFSSRCGLETTNFNIRAANEFTGEALQILAENFTAPRFGAEDVEKQRDIVQKTFKSTALDAQYNTTEQLNRMAFPGSQMDKDSLGSSDIVGKQSFEAVKQFRDQHYTADNMILSVVGDVDHAEIVKLAKAQFGGIKAHPETPRPPVPKATYRGGMEIKSNDASDQVTLRIGFEGSDSSDPKTIQVDSLLASILGGGFSSRLLSKLRSEKGLVYGVGAGNSPMKDCGLFVIATGTHQDKVGQVMDTIAEEVTKFAATVTQKELDTVKNDKLGTYERALAEPTSVSSLLSNKLAKGEVWDVKESIQTIKDVTLDDIKKRATEIFSTAPAIAAFGKGVEKLPSYEEISEKFGKRRTLDASGLAVDTAPAHDRSVKGAEVSAQPQDKKRAIG